MFVYLVVAAVAWGTAGAVASVLYQESGLGPVAVSWWRFVIGAALLAAFIRSRAKTVVAPRRTGRTLAVGLSMAISQTAYFAAVDRSGVAVATVITLGITPLLVAIGERLLLAERVSRRQAGVLAAAIGGLCLLVLAGGNGGGAGTGPASAAGVALAVLSGLTYAGVVLAQRANGSGADPYLGALEGFVIGVVCLLPLALLEGIVPVKGTASAVAMLAYLGAVPTALAYGLFFAALGRVKATTAAVVALLEPVTAAAIGVTLLRERMTLAAVVGALALLLAVVCYPVVADRAR